MHRIGRTGRAGSTGAAISLVDHEEAKYLKDIEKLIKRGIPKVTVEGFEPPAKQEAEAPRPPRPAQARRPQGHGQKNGPARQAGQGQQKTNPNAQKQNQAKQKNQPMPHGRLISEAAKHQAMPQTPLFAPKPVHRGGNRGR